MSVDVWTADLDALPPALHAASILSADELTRAARFRFDHHRHRFTRCRLLLRELLGNELGIHPASIAFRYGPHGKPALDALHFNLSHSGPLAVIAISRDHPLGIDVEQIDRRKDVVPLARTAFSPEECAELNALPSDERIDAFFRGWARKEAYLKLLGTGFSRPSDSFTVSLTREPHTHVEGAALLDLDVHDDFACSLAVAGGVSLEKVRMQRVSS